MRIRSSHLVWLKPVFMFLGFGLLAYFIWTFGWQNVVANLKKVGWGFGIILAISATWHVLNCLAWEQFLRERKTKISLFQLFRIKLAGEAVNTSTPASWVGGDPLRIALMRRFTHTTEGAASVILDRTIHSLTIVILMGAGVVLAGIFLKLPALANELLLGLIIVMVMSMAFSIRHQHKGVLTTAINLLDRIKIGRLIPEKTRRTALQTDETIQSFYRHDKWRLYLSICYQLMGRLLGVLEIYVIAIFLDIPLTFLNAYFLAILNALINFIFVFVPGSVGVLEGAYGGLFHVLSLDPAAGVSLQLVRRLRTMTWTLIGFIFLSIDQHGKGNPHPNKTHARREKQP